jgi:NADPH:quinone reductase-like Zn-dependent oxidoreductase
VAIHGAGGAVGSTAVQLARRAGAEVIGTGRSRSRQLVTELGADRFIALDTDRLEDAAGQADVVFDLVGGDVLARSPALLKPGGVLVSAVSPAPPAGRDDITTVFFIQESSRAQLTEPARLVDEGQLRPRAGGGVPARPGGPGLHREGRRRHPRTDHPAALTGMLPSATCGSGISRPVACARHVIHDVGHDGHRAG